MTGKAPEGVRLLLADGASIRCGVLRDPDRDYDGIAVWAVVPLEDVGAERLAPGCALQVDMLPARTALALRFAVPR